MVNLKKFLLYGALHFLLLALGLLTAVLINSIFWGNSVLPNIAESTDEQKFYKLLTEYAFQLTPRGNDIHFRKGMDSVSSQQFENLLNTLRYKEDCTKHQSWTINNANSCIVDGQQIDFIDQH